MLAMDQRSNFATSALRPITDSGWEIAGHRFGSTSRHFPRIGTSPYRNKNSFIVFRSLDGSMRFPMLRLAMAVAALLLAVAYAQAQTAKHSFSGLCAYYQGRGGGLTAAHKTLPFGTRVRVTDLKTGRSVIVVINDRGPFNKGRVLDLSAAAAKALGVMERGVVSVSADVL